MSCPMSRFTYSGPASSDRNAAYSQQPLVARLCHEAGVVVKYLPPYLPDLSLIEESFSVLKAWLRRNRDIAALFADCFDSFLNVAIAQCDFCSTARNFFKGCGIEVSDKDNDEDYDKLVTGDEMRKEEMVVGH